MRRVRANVARWAVSSSLLLLAACGSDSRTVVDTPVQPPPDSAANPCTDADAALDPACLLQGNVTNVVREVCNVQWLPAICDTVSFDEPGYAVEQNPSPQAPLFLAVGAVHEHSGYSDGDPDMIPRDYFTAGRSGHNTADAGGDTGVIIDFMISSEHSENEKLPVTTAEACIPLLINCANLDELDHYFKWQATLRQAEEGSEFVDESGGRRYTGFTAMRGFEWTNDYFNHINVYLSTNVVNAKIDGSYLSMQFFWNWLREPVAQGGGADALVTFNHPGGNPALTPFDGDTPINELLALIGNSNWDDLAYVPDVDRNVIGIEVNGGDDIEWYIKALERGWHLGPVAAEDEHQREWSTTEDGKTLILTRGRSPQDYYYALQNRRTAAVRHELIGGAPGTRAIFPSLLFWANGTGIQDGAPMGSIVREPGAHALEIDLGGLPAGSPVALISSHAGQAMPLGLADASGALRATQRVDAPASGEDWYFVVVCPVDEAVCGSNRNHLAVTAPIWFGPGS